MKSGLYKKVNPSNNFGAYPAMDAGLSIKKETQNFQEKSEIPLSIASCEGNFELVKRLIENGSDVNQLDTSNLTPIIYAASKGHKNIVGLLVNNGAKISYTLLRIIKAKIDNLVENAKEGREDPFTVADWKNFLEFLIQKGKKQ